MAGRIGRLRRWLSWRWRVAGQRGGIKGEALRAWRGAPRGRRRAPMPGPLRPRGTIEPITHQEIDAMEAEMRNGRYPSATDTLRLVAHATWSPELTVMRTDKGRVVTRKGVRRMAARAARGTGAGKDRGLTPFFAPFYTNPRQGVMYHVIEAVSTQTFAHTVIGTLMVLIMGSGIRPEIYLKNPSDDEEANAKELAKHEDIAEVLRAMDRRIGPEDGGGKTGRMSFHDQVQSLVRSALVFNRGALVIHKSDKPLEVDGKKYEGLPGSLQFVHARDLETIQVDEVGDLVSVSWTSGGRDIMWPDMIYLWNSLGGEEQRMTRWYGRSLIDGCLATLRSVYQVVQVDIPACAKATYAGNVIIPYNVMAYDEEDREAELRKVTESLNPGGVSVVAAAPEDLEVKPVAVQAKMSELVEYLNFAYREVCSAFRIPQSVIFDEAASNRATMTGKLIFTTRGMVRNIRNWVDREVGAQWYGAHLNQVLTVLGKEDLKDEIGVRMAFDDLDMDGDEEKIKKIMELTHMVPLTDKAILQMAGHPELITEVDQEKRERMEEMGVPPGMPAAEGGGPDRDTSKSWEDE